MGSELAPTSPTEVPQGELIQQRLQAIGLDPQLEIVTVHATFELLRKGYDVAWSAVTPASFMVDRWIGSARRTGGQFNVSNYSDPKADAMALAQIRELDLKRRKQVINEFEDYLYEAMPYAPVVAINYFRFQSCRLQNMNRTIKRRTSTA